MSHEPAFNIANSSSDSDSATQFGAIKLVSGSDSPRRGYQESAVAAVILSWQFASIQAAIILVASEAAEFGYHYFVFGVLDLSLTFAAVGLMAATLFVGGMRITDETRRLRRPAGSEALRDVSIVWICAILLITFLTFSLKAGSNLSRGGILTFVVLGYAAVIGGRVMLPRLLANWTRAGRAYADDILIIGAENSPMIGRITTELAASGHHDISVVTLKADCDESEWDTELPSSLGRIFAKAREGGHGDICIAAEGFSHPRLRDLTEAIRIVPRAVRLVPDSVFESLLHLPLRATGSFYSIELQKAPMRKLQRAAKRGLDLLIAIPVAIFIAPFLFMIAVLIKVDSKGPILFLQRRLGYRGRPFKIFKFRTMSVLEDGSEIKQATPDDMRITRVGRWLRKASLDELPQLGNVILGEMSLVGPRPHAASHDKFYATLIQNYEIRQHVRPGITGWAQVNGLRGETTKVEAMQQRVQYDIWYAKNASILLDLVILLRTAIEVFKQKNAY